MSDDAIKKNDEVLVDSAARLAVKSLKLFSYRNYSEYSLELESSPVVITGANGSGKTNLLEAVSFLSAGRGLRGIKLAQADNVKINMPWAVSAEIIKGDDEYHIGTARDAVADGNKRMVKIDHELVKSQSELAEIMTVMWQTPQMDGLFNEGLTERRKFLDRLVYNFDSLHATRVNQYEHAMRERNKLLKERGDLAWIGILESKMAELAVSIAAARNETLERIQEEIFDAPTEFPKAILRIDGWVEMAIKNASALVVEEQVKEMFKESRQEDRFAGRALFGTHRSEFLVTHKDKNMPAASCSTGEQKALMLSIILAEARAKIHWKKMVPLLLLDEVVAHLDECRRRALFDEILAMNAQAWLTGTDEGMFLYLKDKAQFLQF